MNTAAARVADAIANRKPWIGIRSLVPASPRLEVLSGLTVSLALVPEALAFAFVAGVDPMVGLYSTFFICLIAALFGGVYTYAVLKAAETRQRERIAAR